MSVGTPVVCTVPGEAQAIYRRMGGGIITRPDETKNMANASMRMHRHPELRQQIGAAAKGYVGRFYNRAIIAANLEGLLTKFVTSANRLAWPAAGPEPMRQRVGKEGPRLPGA
jgi:glycosyltransferase involved in cell wall biosynthesis